MAQKKKAKQDPSERFTWRMITALIFVVALSTLASALLVITFMVAQIGWDGGFEASIFSRGRLKTAAPAEVTAPVATVSKTVTQKQTRLNTRIQQSVARKKASLESSSNKIERDFTQLANRRDSRWMTTLEARMDLFLQKVEAEEVPEDAFASWKTSFINLIEDTMRALLDTLHTSFVTVCGVDGEKACMYEGEVFAAMQDFYTDAYAFLDELEAGISAAEDLDALVAFLNPSDPNEKAPDEKVRDLRWQYQSIQADAGIYWIEIVEEGLFTVVMDKYFDDPSFEGGLLPLPLENFTPLYQGLEKVEARIADAPNALMDTLCCKWRPADCEEDLTYYESTITDQMDLTLGVMANYRTAIVDAKAKFASAKAELEKIKEGVPIEDFLRYYLGGQEHTGAVMYIGQGLEGVVLAFANYIYDGNGDTDTDVVPYMDELRLEFEALNCSGYVLMESAYLIGEAGTIKLFWDNVMVVLEDIVAQME